MHSLVRILHHMQSELNYIFSIKVLMHHPSIKAAGVVGVPDERLGEEMAACIILKDGVQKPSVEDIRRFCKV